MLSGELESPELTKSMEDDEPPPFIYSEGEHDIPASGHTKREPGGYNSSNSRGDKSPSFRSLMQRNIPEPKSATPVSELDPPKSKSSRNISLKMKALNPTEEIGEERKQGPMIPRPPTKVALSQEFHRP